VAIIGAGIAGCAAARVLAEAGHGVTLFDKGRVAGGRLASKRLHTPAGILTGAIGAQLASADGSAFGERLATLAAAGHVARWQPAGLDRCKTRFVGLPDMRALVADTGGVATLRTGVRVERLSRGTDGWRLFGEGLAEGPFAALVVSAPAPQAAPLLRDAAPHLAARVSQARMAPCWAALLWFGERVQTPFDASVFDHPLLAWAAREGSRPGVAVPGDLWAVQAGPGWSAANLERAEEHAGAALATAFAGAAGTKARPDAIRAHRWRFAQVTRPVGVPSLVEPALGLATAGDWQLGPGIEAAWESGRAAGLALLETLA
jgi:renalase